MLPTNMQVPTGRSWPPPLLGHQINKTLTTITMTRGKCRESAENEAMMQQAMVAYKEKQKKKSQEKHLFEPLQWNLMCLDQHFKIILMECSFTIKLMNS